MLNSHIYSWFISIWTVILLFCLLIENVRAECHQRVQEVQLLNFFSNGSNVIDIKLKIPEETLQKTHKRLGSAQFLKKLCAWRYLWVQHGNI